MNEEFALNSELVWAWMDKEERKRSYLVKHLGVCDRLLGMMLNERHVPKKRTLKKLADLIGVEERQLLLPKAAA